MLIAENIRLAISGLRANKMRALLTMLGIIIGISSVIAIMTVGNSLKGAMSDSSPGSNNITITIMQKMQEGMDFETAPRKEPTDADYISVDMIEALYEEFPDKIESFSASESVGSGIVEDGRRYAYVSVSGNNKTSIEQSQLKMLGGRVFNSNELNDASMVCIVSDYFVNNMYGGNIDRALGENIEVSIKNKTYNFVIVGVYKYIEQSISFQRADPKDTSTTLYIPVKAAKRINRNENYRAVDVVPKMDVDATALMNDINEFMNDEFYKNNEFFEVSAYSFGLMLGSITAMMSTVTIGISVIAGIALLVGGIGVMNIMLVSITERTREIGTRKALGAPNSSIRIQFIVESIVICTIGGIIGTILGIAGGLGATKLMSASLDGVSGTVDPMSIAIAFGFSMAIGVFFGYYPANKAAKLDPIEA